MLELLATEMQIDSDAALQNLKASIEGDKSTLLQRYYAENFNKWLLYERFKTFKKLPTAFFIVDLWSTAFALLL